MADPTRFEIYCKGAGRWQRLASFDGRDRAAALIAAETYDAAADVEGVRVMAVQEFSTGRAPLETLEWISPHLAKAAPTDPRRRRWPAAPPAPSAPRAGPGVSADNRAEILRFLDIVLRQAATAIPRLDQYVTFGLHLLLAGAARGLGARKGLTEMQRFVLLRECVEGIGTAPDQVDQFCRSFFEYLTDSGHRHMVDVGEQAIGCYLDGDEERALARFRDALRGWSEEAQARAMSQGAVAIMFTDLVGATQMTPARGDDGAEQAVRTHNAIVRAALAEFQGTEVKHTGDGIMARFSSAPRAVGAAMAIQGLLQRHNADRRNAPVHVRIGLNAGDAIGEADDYVGHTVQMSARVCDKAAAGEIYATDAIRALCRSHDIAFADAGRFELKGLPDPVPLYEVGWRAEARPETAPEPADA